MPKPGKKRTLLAWQITVTEYHLNVYGGRSIPVSNPTKGPSIDMITLVGKSKDDETPAECNFTLRFYTDGSALREPKRSVPEDGKAGVEVEFNHAQLPEILHMLRHSPMCYAAYGASVLDVNKPEKDRDRSAFVNSITKK